MERVTITIEGCKETLAELGFYLSESADSCSHYDYSIIREGLASMADQLKEASA